MQLEMETKGMWLEDEESFCAPKTSCVRQYMHTGERKLDLIFQMWAIPTKQTAILYASGTCTIICDGHSRCQG